jgi:hypothetical protein
MLHPSKQVRTAVAAVIVIAALLMILVIPAAQQQEPGQLPAQLSKRSILTAKFRCVDKLP